MFNKEKSNPAEKFSNASATLISAGTVLKGDLRSEADLRIDGTIHGNISSKAKIIVGPTGFVEGNITAANTDISGRIQGNITVQETAQLRGQSHVDGNVTSGSLQIEAGAMFNGKSQMGTAASVVQMKEEPHAKAK